MKRENEYDEEARLRSVLENPQSEDPFPEGTTPWITR
jgi:hypothetical protein